ncbi:MFS transporter [Zhenpiania hominis]|uniref:MFS transporter n=1 Tax=Zhenpiania hominis TaxID=2763644 RepID=A0A923NL14_9FIRM|nr:MFS transporter [Zhenpiania hominis]MBC6679875.1 MFS transporter [Zhenpiania hominis]
MKKVKDVIMDQPKLGINVFAGSIMVLTAVVWMALDIYLPALPILKEEFKVSATYLNLTLTAGIIATAIGTLIGGPMSDKYGRKPVFASGVGLSLLFTFLCTFAGSVDFLIVVRGLASLGNGIILTVTTAMIKDTFSGRTFKNVMTVLQSAAIIGPILAPSVGSVIITWLSWRWLFVFIAVVSVVPAALILFARETWPEGKRISDSALKAVSDTLHTAGDKPFALFAGVMAVLTIPMWAYISVCSYIYITDFGISNMQYGIFYALGAGVSCISPFLYMVITRHSSTGRACEVCLGLILLSGVMLIAVGGRAPVLFLLSTLPFIIAEGMIRALGMVVLLEQYSHVAGAASAMINFVLNLIGTVGASLATLDWGSYITALAVICLGCMAAALLLWIIIVRQKIMEERLFGPSRR